MINLVILDKKYILTDEGRLFNRITGEEFIPTCDGGYQQLCRYIDGTKKSVKIHQLVMYYLVHLNQEIIMKLTILTEIN